MRAAAVTLLMLAAASAHALSPYRPVPDAPAETCRLGEWTGVAAKDEKEHMPGCPQEARDLVDRALGCQHWTGEEPYDAARGHEIETAINELQCDKLSLQHDAILKKYAKDPNVTAALEAADREYNIEF